MSGFDDQDLDVLAERHGTDKGSSRHGYTAIYEPFLRAIRHERVHVLEIGVKHGASLRMWRDYFPAGDVFGIDIDPAAAQHAGERIAVFIGDQSDPDFLAEVVTRTGGLHLVVDDGSHRAGDQRAALLALWEHVEGDGIYVVEDTHTSYRDDYGMGLRVPGSTIELLKDRVDDIEATRHGEPPALPRLDSVHFYPGTCLLMKRGARAAARRPHRVRRRRERRRQA